MNQLLNLPRTRIPLWGRRVPVRADHLNQMVDPLNALMSGVEPPQQVRSDVRGSVQQFKILTDGIYDEYLLCRTYDNRTGQLGRANIRVARPWGLRAYDVPLYNSTDADRPGWVEDGYTYTYMDPQTRFAINNDSGITGVQVVIKRYFIGNVIHAANNILGGLSLSAPVMALAGGVDWMQINSLKAWGKKFGTEYGRSNTNPI